MIEKPDDTIPGQREGIAVNVEDSVTFQTDEEATAFFQVVKARLLNVNNWGDIDGALSADFKLTDKSGNILTRAPQTGDYFMIDIPAPGIKTGDGHDWVQIEMIEEEAKAVDETIAIRVRPTSNPMNLNPDVAHFYTDDATSNFIVKREGKTVTAGVYGRNEKPNITEADSLFDIARNAIVGAGGVTFFSKLQWKALVSGLLER